MRSTWPFFAGVIVAVLVTAFTLPILVAAGLAMMALGSVGHDDAALGGNSSFRLRDEHGRLTSRLSNTNYSIVSVPVKGEPRPRRVLLRLKTAVSDEGDGNARLDAWPLDTPEELRRPPLYTVRVQAGSAVLGDDSMLWTERKGRRTAYSLADGGWLFDADLPVANFAFDSEARRVAALSVADEEYSTRGGVAVISYAAPGRVLRRVVLVADDPLRVNTLRASLSATRLLTFADEAVGGRVIELPLASGPLRIPVGINDLDLARAVIPVGLRLVAIRPWGVAAN